MFAQPFMGAGSTGAPLRCLRRSWRPICALSTRPGVARSSCSSCGGAVRAGFGRATAAAGRQQWRRRIHGRRAESHDSQCMGFAGRRQLERAIRSVRAESRGSRIRRSRWTTRTSCSSMASIRRRDRRSCARFASIPHIRPRCLLPPYGGRMGRRPQMRPQPVPAQTSFADRPSSWNFCSAISRCRDSNLTNRRSSTCGVRGSESREKRRLDQRPPHLMSSSKQSKAPGTSVCRTRCGASFRSTGKHSPAFPPFSSSATASSGRSCCSP